MAAAAHRPLHIAMVPWLAFGHFIPYLELAKLLAQKGHRISFLSTPRNISRLPPLPPSLSPLITFVELPFPRHIITSLPDSAEATCDLPYNQVPLLKKAVDGLKEPITSFLENSQPDFVFYDFAPYWLPAIATNLGISHAFFSIFTAALVAFMSPPCGADDPRSKPEDYATPPPWIPFPTSVTFRMFEVLKASEAFEHDDSKVTDAERFNEVINGCELILVRSCHEYEPEWIKLLQDKHRKPVVPVGLVPTTEEDSGEETETWRSIKQWLDGQEKGSVVYVAFGSEAKPSQDELTELALGLELSGLPFFWVLRNRRGLADTEVIQLPDGFEERTKGKGMVWTSWAPQLKIIAHNSVGGFLSHSGFTSVVEAWRHQRPLILFPIWGDQHINERVLNEKKMGYPIPRNELDGSCTRHSVAECLRLVMVEEEGKIYREKAKEMSHWFEDKDIQDRYIDDLLGQLTSHLSLKKNVAPKSMNSETRTFGSAY